MLIMLIMLILVFLSILTNVARESTKPHYLRKFCFTWMALIVVKARTIMQHTVNTVNLLIYWYTAQ